MNVETDRQWFVYFKETEMGPFPESELLQKIKIKEIDDTAFVYTEGMSDWELIKDSALQKVISRVEPVKSAHKETSSTVTNLHEASSRLDSPSGFVAEAQPVVSESLGVKEASTSAAKKQRAPGMGLKGMAAILFFVLVGAGYFLNKSVIDSYFSGGASSKLIDLSAQTPAPQTTNVEAAQDTSVNWGELDAFVRIQDPQGPAFRLANKSLGGMRPIIVGALSPLHKQTSLTVAVFPDNDRSLYAVPPLWISDVGVQSGYFSVGPHLNKGQDLLPGRYRVLVASAGKFLGDVSIEIGSFPLGEALSKKKTDIQNEVLALVAAEKDSLKTKIQALSAFSQKLSAASSLAMEGSSKRNLWLAQRVAFEKEIADLREQQMKVVQGPMFYPVDQNLLLAAVASLDLDVQGLEAYSQGGVNEVKSKLNSTVQNLNNNVHAAMTKLEASAKDLDGRNVAKPLTISAENIKARLLVESK